MGYAVITGHQSQKTNLEVVGIISFQLKVDLMRQEFVL